MKDVLKTAEAALAALRENGADMAGVVAAYTETREFNVDGGQFSLLRTLFDDSLSLAGYRQGRKGTAMINRFDDGSIQAAARECMLSAEAAEPDEAWDLAPGQGLASYTDGCPQGDMDALFSRLRELMDTLNREHPLILVEQLIASHRKYRAAYRNSKGAAFLTEGGAYRVEIMYSGHQGEQSSSFFSTSLTLDNLDRPLLECGSLARDVADVERQIHTQTLEGKFRGTVILSPSCLGEVLASAVENFAGDYAILNGTGLWKDKLGQPVASPCLTVSARPRDSRVVCGERFTGEGFPAQDRCVIEQGVLRDFDLSLYVANRTGGPRASCSLANLVVEPGDRPLEEILASVSRGILVGRISGGSPGANGEFSMVAKNSFLVENGKIAGAVSETMINGNLGEMLQNVCAISRETVCDGTTCLPWAAFTGVTISGK